MRSACKRGHPYNKRDTIYRGTKRSCTICNRMLINLRYQNDVAYRSRKLAQMKDYRALKREQQPAS